jgi:hypothetical protein
MLDGVPAGLLVVGADVVAAMVIVEVVVDGGIVVDVDVTGVRTTVDEVVAGSLLRSALPHPVANAMTTTAAKTNLRVTI